LVFAAAGLLVLVLSWYLWPAVAGETQEHVDKRQHTILLTTLILLGITALLRALTDGEAQPLKGDTRLRWLAGLAIPAYLLSMYIPWSTQFFALVPLGPLQWLLVLAIVVPAYLLSRLGDRFLSKCPGWH
jgi:hypothetical protein